MNTEPNEDSVEFEEQTTTSVGKSSNIASWINKKTLLSVFAGILMAVVTSWVNKKLDQLSDGPDSYNVYVVGGNYENNRIKNDEFMKGVYEAIEKVWRKEGILQIDGKNVKVKYVADRWDPQQAYEVSRDIANKADTLMVIGHFASSTTREALKHYLSTEPPIPVILTTETNPNLIPETYKQDRAKLPVLRLWPTDDEQAKDIAKYAIKTNDKTFWVVEDGRNNKVYSHYLAEKIIRELQKHGKQVILWTKHWYVPPANTLRELNIESVFFPGSPSNALIFVNQIRAIWDKGNGQGPKPKIFLTDTAVSDLVQEKNKELDGVYVTHPGLEHCKNIKAQKGHIYLAQDAAHIARHIVAKANDKLQRAKWRELLNVKSVVDARQAIIKVINKHIKNNNFNISSYDTVNNSGEETVQFDVHGNRLGAEFKLWQIQNGRFLAVNTSEDNLVADPCQIDLSKK